MIFPSPGTPGEGEGGGLSRPLKFGPHPNPPPGYQGRGNCRSNFEFPSIPRYAIHPMTRSKNLRFLSPLLALFLLQCCEHPTASGLPVTTMEIDGESFTLEIATSSHDQEVGLMHRDSMDDDHGMIFVFPDEDERIFWNHDVHFGLDILFLDGSGKILSIKQMPRYSEQNYHSDGNSKYVIELNEGVAAKLGLSPGMTLQIPPDAASAHAP